MNTETIDTPHLKGIPVRIWLCCGDLDPEEATHFDSITGEDLCWTQGGPNDDTDPAYILESVQTAEIERLKQEIEACLNACPHTIRCHEGGGLENLAASLALTFHSMMDHLSAARAALEELQTNPRDEYHTMRELYDYRMLYNAHACHGWLASGLPVVKSWRHSDGEECFGGGWFIVVATLPTGQVSNHYKAEHWDLFSVPEVDLPPEFDGHTPADVAVRLGQALAQSGRAEGGAQ